MDPPRVVSLAPSATATLNALDAADLLVGITHHCTTGSGAGAAHDTEPTAVGGWITPDLDRVAELDPDLVCTSDGLQADIAADCRERGWRVSHAEPTTLADVLDRFADLAGTIGRDAAGATLVADATRRLETVAAAVDGSTAPRPVVYCEEWSDPPMAAGNWVPDAVRAAGGRYPFVEAGERSREVDPSTVEAADPDHVVLHVCGHGDRVDPATVNERGWAIDAPVHVLDDSLLNQPSPALIDGIERLAALFHPEAFS
ncbi:helical backbone metal receptor [Halorubrum vacuolatum]|uniref:Iron complex transport system substrate-binding protein n=1 Tax=Halorubrum vacuolatum TaxID=63740 RepID=A0A238W1E7_HALVU|nr:helical backbone metal receptor [Halorubrum vacuolatum]SNR40346.1 iron complex transport system substrate-binding protein [Halorubrum vacuolatum]